MPSGMVASADRSHWRLDDSVSEPPLWPNQAAAPYAAHAAATSASGASAVSSGAWPGRKCTDTPTPTTTAAKA